MNPNSQSTAIPNQIHSSLPALIGVAVIAALVASGVDFVIARIATPLVYARADYPSFTGFPIFVGCIVGALGAAFVLATMQRFSYQPNQRFARTAIGVLLVSYLLPIVPLMMPIERFVGVNWGIALVLMLMHTVAAAIITFALLRFSSPRA